MQTFQHSKLQFLRCVDGIRPQALRTSLSFTVLSAMTVNGSLANSGQAPFAPVTRSLAHQSGFGNLNGVTAGGPSLQHHLAPLNSTTWVLHAVSDVQVNNGKHALVASVIKNSSAQSLSVQSSTSPSGPQQNLDLNSPVAMFQAGSLAGFHSITLDIGGQKESVSFDTRLTGAELIAAQQVLSSGKQSLVLNNQGEATGGTFKLNLSTLAAIDPILGGGIGSLDISHGVVALDTLSSLSLTGALVNQGTIDLGAIVGTKGQIVDTITAASINNTASGNIASAVGVSGVVGTGVALAATGTFTNSGSVSSNHDLSITAASINNAGAVGVAGLKAAGDINLTTASLNNSGLISSGHGDVNVANAAGSSTLNVTATGGTIQALNGNINLNSTSDNSAGGNINVAGGNWRSEQVNFNAGSGSINASLGQVTGVVNGTAGSSHITAATEDLQLGNLDVSGDPTYFNTAGNITIDGTIAPTLGADLAIVASGNIIGNGGKLDTSSTKSNAGNLTLIAGANFTNPTTGSNITGDTTTTITLANSSSPGNGSATGGYIDLSGVTLTGVKTNAPVSINTSSTAGSGGNVLMVAYAGSGPSSGSNSGSIVATPTTAQNKGVDSINTSGSDGQGNLTIIGGGSTIQMQNVSLGASSGSGTITVLGTTPTIAGGSLTILNGAVTGSYLTTTAPTNTNISFGNLTAGNINLSTAGTLSQVKATVITGGNTTLTAGAAGTSASPVQTNTSNLLTINGNSTTGTINVNEQNSGTVNLSGASTAPGQSVSVTSVAQNLDVTNLNFTNVTLTDNGTKTTPGNIEINTAGVAGNQVGELYSTASSSTDSLGTGTIKITASGSITEGTGDNGAVIVGQTVVLSSMGSNIGTFGSPDVPLTIVGANLTANATKGNVLINDLVQTTLNAGSSGTTGTFVYDVTGNGLAVAGAINGNIIDLTAGPGTVSGGPGTVLAINANVGSSKTQNVQLSGSSSIIETSSKAVIQGSSVNLSAATGTIGSAQQSITTKATQLVINSIGGTAINAFVSQSGTVMLGTSSDSNGVLTLATTGPVTVGGSASATVDLLTLNLNAPSLVVGGNGTINVTNLAVQSSGTLSISGVAATKSAPASTGTINVSGALSLGGSGGGQASSITIGAKDGSSDPLASVFNGSAPLSSITVNTKGVFTVPVSNIAISTDGGSITINASGLTNTQSGLNSAVILNASGTGLGGNITFNLNGTTSLSLGGAAGQYSLVGGTNSNVTVIGKGTINVMAAGLVAPMSGALSDVTLSAGTVNFGDSSGSNAPTLNTQNLLVVANNVGINQASVLNASNSATFTGKGALAITSVLSGGSIGQLNTSQLSLGSATVLVAGSANSYVTSSITLGDAKNQGANNPLTADLGDGGSNGVLQNLTVSTTGNFSLAANNIALSQANPGNLSITAEKINNLITPASILTISVNATGTVGGTGTDVAPGNLSITLTGSQPTSIGTSGNFNVSATNLTGSTNNAGINVIAANGGSISLITTGDLTYTPVQIMLANNSSFSAQSSGTLTANGLGTLAGGVPGFPAVMGVSYSLTGLKALAVNNIDLFAGTEIVNLSLTSGSTKTFTIAGEEGVVTPVSNGVSGSLIGENLQSVSLHVGAGIDLGNNGSIAVAPTGTLIFASTGQLTITGAGTINNGEYPQIKPGYNLAIIGNKGIQLGTPNPMGLDDPFVFLAQPSLTNLDPVGRLNIQTNGTFSYFAGQIVLNSSSDPNFDPPSIPAAFTATSSTQTPMVSAASNLRTLDFDPPPSSSDVVTIIGRFQGYTGKQVGGDTIKPVFKLILDNLDADNSNLSLSQSQNFAMVGQNSTLVSSTNLSVLITDTSSQSLTLGQNQAASTPTIGIISAIPVNVTINSTSSVTVGDTSSLSNTPNAGVSLPMGGSISINSAATVAVKTGGISLGAPTDLNISGAKGLAVLDPNITSDPNLNSLILASGATSSFVVNSSSPTLTNGTAGNITAPTVTLTVSSLTNNGSISGVAGDMSALNIGSAGKNSFTVVPSTSGSYSNFSSVNITSQGNITLGDLFTASVLPASSVSSISITGLTVNNVIAPAGTVTFSPSTPNNTLSVGFDSATGAGGTIYIEAKAIAASPGFTFDASAVQTPGTDLAGTVSITTTSALTLGTASGNIMVNVGGSGAGGTVNLTSTGGVLTINGSSPLQFGSGNLIGNSVVINKSVAADDVLTVNTNGKIGTGTVTETAGSTIAAGTQLFIGQGTSKLAATPLSTSTPDLEFLQGALNIANTNLAAGGTAINTTGGPTVTALTLTNTGATATTTTIGSITTTAGSINITDNTASGTVAIAANSTLATTAGSIFLNASSTTSSIDIGTGVTIYGSGTAPGVGQVTIVAGPIPTGGTFIAGLAPQSAASTPALIQTVGGSVLFGASGNTGGTITAQGSNNVISALGRNVILYQGNGTITLSGDDSITADPPTTASVQYIGAFDSAANANITSVNAAASANIQSVSAVVSPLTMQTSSATTNTQYSYIANAAFPQPSLTQGLTNAWLQASNNQLLGNDLTDTKSQNIRPESFIGALTTSDTKVSNSIDNHDKLKGSISNVARREFGEGATLLSPETDTIINTDFASVSLAAHSVVLVLAFDGGIGVYNLHDSKKGAVVVRCRDHIFTLAPGFSCVLTNRNVRYFEEINPVQFVGYHSMVAKDHGDGVKSFQSQFNVPSLLMGVKPLQHLALFPHKDCKKAIASVLKTSAILDQLSSHAYQLMTLAPVSAFRGH